MVGSEKSPLSVKISSGARFFLEFSGRAEKSILNIVVIGYELLVIVFQGGDKYTRLSSFISKIFSLVSI